MNRCGRLAFSALAVVSLSTVVGCGEDELSDDAYGALDLTPFYADGASAANPRQAVPVEMRPTKAWFDGKRAELYDFGVVNHRRKRNAAGATIREPEIAYVNQMYFFFDSQGRPMFSKPLFDERTGTWSMKGGQNLLDPNPLPAPEGNQAAVYYATPYSQRLRRTVNDPLRGVDDYQRPIIDKLHNDSTYTGLWEIVHVQAQAGYVPDSIKSKKTLDAAIDAKKVSIHRTLSVINCPVIEEATWVVPTSMYYRQPDMQRGTPGIVVPRPRVELWYRTKLGFCFLANGMETLANINGDSRDPGNVELLPFREVGLDTFDVIRYGVGAGNNRVELVEALVSKLYIPRSTISVMRGTTATQDFRYGTDDLISALPRSFPNDPPGYSPIIWLHDVVVPQDPPYVFGSFKKLSDIDPAKITPRDTATTVWTKNMPVAGVASTCTSDAQCPDFGMKCNNLPDAELAAADTPSGQNLADVMANREGGPRCDVPAVGFGEFCAPAVARCQTHVVASEEAGTILSKSGAGGPAFAVHAALDRTIASTDPMVTQAMKDAAMASKQNWINRGYPADLSGKGYYCQPTTSTGGYCYVRCDGGGSAGTAPSGMDAVKLKKMLDVEADPRRPQAGTRQVEATFGFDARCGGLELLGYKCLPGSGRPNRQRVCMRECTTRDTEGFNKALCSYFINDKPATPEVTQEKWRFSAGQLEVDKLDGQSCSNLSGITACMWNPDFEPRDPATRTVP